MADGGQRGPETNAAAFDPAKDDVFARIAGRYDRMCDLFSLFIHRRWKSRMAAAVARHPGEVVLDLASGTGDIPLRMLRRDATPGRVIWVTDICPQMLDMARRKLAGRDAVRFAIADAQALTEIESGSVDLCTMSFGMKICDRARVMREAFRVLRPGGSFFCLEAARIRLAPLHALYLVYMRWCMPIVGRVATGGDASAYAYLLRGIHDFPDQRSLAAELEGCGFRDVGWDDITLGIVALHRATKPA